MRVRSLLIATAVAAVTFGVALPAQADTSGASVATVTVPGGVLSITVTPDAGNLGYKLDPAGNSVSGQLGQVYVADARNSPAGAAWVASVVSTPFTSAFAAIPASAVSYTAGPINHIGIATLTAQDPRDLTLLSPVVTATAITGNNAAAWNPTITVAIPGGTTAGTYSATITHSVV
jgi:hypothetical protein